MDNQLKKGQKVSDIVFAFFSNKKFMDNKQLPVKKEYFMSFMGLPSPCSSSSSSPENDNILYDQMFKKELNLDRGQNTELIKDSNESCRVRSFVENARIFI